MAKDESGKSRAGKWTRRGLLITGGVLAGGGLVIGVAVRPGHRSPRLQPLVADDDEALLNVWVKITPDNTVVAIVPHAEMGQGVHSALAQMLADEMDADWDSVKVMEAPAHEEYANYALVRGLALGEADVPAFLVDTVDGALLELSQIADLQMTGGSFSLRLTGVHAMRVAGAAARQVLAEAAAATWQVPTDELRLERSLVTHPPTGRKGRYADFAAAAAALVPPAKPRLKAADEFQVMGRSKPRLDIPPKVDGSARFGIDAQVDGMKIATIRRAPVFGGRLLGVDDSRAVAMPGVERVVVLPDAVAVVADGYWHAQRGLASLDVQWSGGGREAISQDDIYAQFRRDLDAADGDGDVEVGEGDIDQALAGAAQRLDAEYEAPFLAHATMEPMNCAVWPRDGVCDVWVGSQNPLGVRTTVANVLELEPDNVTVHNGYLGGGFGRRVYPDYAEQAAQVAKAVDGPVKLIWSREEDIAQDRYRPATISRFRGGLDDSGRPVAWVNLYVNKHEPAEAPRIPYAIDNQRIASVASPTHVPFGFWRSVDHSQHAFFTESYIDELATLAGADPYRFRRDLLAGAPRDRTVLDAAAERAGWGVPLPAGRGRGIALHRSFGSIVAEVAEVTVGAGGVRVDRVVCAVDAGLAINPDGLIAQMESGIVYGLTAALYGEITIRDGAVAQSNFHDYPMLRIDAMPVIETVIVNSGEALGGAGEPSTPPIAPAVANAVYAATGQRIRRLPLSRSVAVA